MRNCLAAGQNQWCHFGVGAAPILAYFSGDWHVHWGYGILAHGCLKMAVNQLAVLWPSNSGVAEASPSTVKRGSVQPSSFSMLDQA